MKKVIIILFIIPVFAFAQTEEELDFVAPFYDGLSAVKKGNSWGFIDIEGNIVIPFRDDLVLTKIDGHEYPVFKNNRCLISKNKDGITYFGYIGVTGKTIIKPKFLNASNFCNNQAIVLHILKENLGNNDVLGKNVVNYKYCEVVINVYGEIQNYLNIEGVNFVLDKEFLRTPPKITSTQISDNIYAVSTKNNKWRIVNVRN